jgi:regulatory protein
VRHSRPDVADPGACERAALDLLARREHSRRELERKLAARGFPADLIAPALDALEESGELASARFTESFIRARAAKGQGPARIRAELAERGIDRDQADEYLREADVDWAAAASSVRDKRFGAERPTDFKERARQARFLQYRGFDSEQIGLALGSGRRREDP